MVSWSQMRAALATAVVLVLVTLPPARALAWPTAGCLASSFHAHGDIAAHVLDDPTIAPLLAPLGLTRDGAIAAARNEPTCYMDHHPGWSELANQSHLAWPLSDATIGVILHVGGDSGVPVDHCPGCEVFVDTSVGQQAESVIEGSAELTTVPPLAGLYTGTYDEQMNAFHTDEVALATAYKAFWEGGSCPLCNTTPYATTGMTNGERMAYAALRLYLEAHPAPQRDAGQDDAAPADDAGVPADAGAQADASVPADAGAVEDAAAADATRDAAAADAPAADAGGGNGSGGCGCRAAGAPRAAGLVLALLAAATLGRRRRP
jgi:MYXO-CTERM domain-containing protein